MKVYHFSSGRHLALYRNLRLYDFCSGNYPDFWKHPTTFALEAIRTVESKMPQRNRRLPVELSGLAKQARPFLLVNYSAFGGESSPHKTELSMSRNAAMGLPRANQL